MPADVALWLWLGLVGPVAGSFVAAMADRLCSGRSPVAPSACAGCGQRLAWRDMVPILSWLALRGRCRSCKGPIPRRLLLAEVAGLAAAVAAIGLGGGPVGSVALAVWLWALIGLALADIRCLRLPDPMTATLFAAGLVIGSLTFGWMTALLTGLGAAAVLWALAAAYRSLRGRPGLGLGDVKMIAGIGAALGPLALPWVTLVAAALAIAGAALRRSAPGGAQPFGAALAVAAALVLAGVRLGG